MQIRIDDLVAVYDCSLKIVLLLIEYHTFVLKFVFNFVLNKMYRKKVISGDV